MAKKPKPRHTNRLTVKRIARLKTGRHIDGGGLSLLVSPIGTKSWSFPLRAERTRQRLCPRSAPRERRRQKAGRRSPWPYARRG